MSSAMTLQVTGLGRRKMAEVSERAKGLGMTPKQYVKHLLETDLAIAREARTTTFAEIMAPVREEFRQSGMTERQLDELVDRARTRRRGQNRRRKK